jgi:hypothetical protein
VKKSLLFIGTLLLAFTIGAATGTKISATLQNQSIVYNGATSTQKVISYNGTTYVPLRGFSDLVKIPVKYSNSTIYLGANNTESTPIASTKDKYTFIINSVETGVNYEDKQVAIVNISFANNSGETQSPLGSLYSVNAYQNGVELEASFDGDLTENDSYVSVLSGSTLKYGQLFVLKDKSPITIEIAEFLGDKKISKTFNIN